MMKLEKSSDMKSEAFHLRLYYAYADCIATNGYSTHQI